MAVPLFDTETPLAPLRPRIVEKVTEVIDAGRFVLGPEVQARSSRVRRRISASDT